MIARKIIDARSPQAKAMRLRKATVGMDGGIIDGEDVISRNRVTVPDAPRTFSTRPTFMPDLLAQHKASQTERNDSQVTAYRDSLRRAADANRVREAVAAEKLKQEQRREGTGPAEIVDMRPSGNKPSADGNPRGMAYLNALADISLEQGNAARAEAASGVPRDYSKAGIHYAKDEAERRANAPVKITAPANTSRVVLTDPKYGGTGVGYATRPARVNPLTETSSGVTAGMRDINRQIAAGTPAPKLTPAIKTAAPRINPLMPAAPKIDKPSPAANDALMAAANRTKTGPATKMAPEIAPMAEKVGYAMGADGLSHPDSDGNQYDRDGYLTKNGQRYNRRGNPMYGPSVEEISRKVRGMFSL